VALKASRYLLVFLVIALAVLGLAAVGCGGDDETTTTTAAGADTTTTEGDTDTTAAAGDGAPFKIGLAAPFTGQYANYGASHRGGADIAVEELNEQGGVNGGEVSYAIGDDQGDPREAVLVAQGFIDDAEIVFVNGHMFSGATIAAGANYEQAGLPMVSPSATNPDISDLGDFIWRICMTDAFQGAGLAEYTVNDLGMGNVAILLDDSDYGRGLADAYEQGIQDAGGTVVARAQYTTGDTDFRAQLTQIRQANPEMLFLSGYYPEGSRIAQQARELGIEAQMLGSDGYASDELISLGGQAVEGMLLSTFFDYSRDDPAVQQFVSAFRERNNDQNPDWFAASSYDVIMVVAEAANLAGSNDRDAINEALGELGSYEGITGTIIFDENGDVQKPLNIVVVRGGELVTADQQPSASDAGTNGGTTGGAGGTTTTGGAGGNTTTTGGAGGNTTTTGAAGATTTSS
jgi:branched-chain amino acid transport system substrate-binding protein